MNRNSHWKNNSNEHEIIKNKNIKHYFQILYYIEKWNFENYKLQTNFILLL